jgi:hypothetical protein
MGLGYACKQTALIQFIPIAGVTFLFLRDVRRSMGMVSGFAAMTGGLTLVYSMIFGNAYLRQTFWFHFIKGAVAPWPVKAAWTAAGIGFPMVLAVAVWPGLKKLKDPVWIPIGMVAADIVFFWFVPAHSGRTICYRRFRPCA